MDRIPQIESAPAIMNEAAGRRELWHFLRRVHNTLSEEDPRYPFYLTWLSEAATNSARTQVGPDSIESLQRRLEQTDRQNQEHDPDLIESLIEEEEVGIVQYRFSMLYVLCNVYLNLGEVENAIDVLDDYQQEFREKPLYQVLRGEVLIQLGTQESTDNAIHAVWKARNDQPDWPEVQKGVAGVIAETIGRDLVYQGYNADIPDNRGSLLLEAKQSIDAALDEIPDHPEYLFIKGRIQALDTLFDAARRTIRQAIEELSPQRPGYDRVVTQYRIELSTVDIQEQEHLLRTETSDAISQLEDIREDYKELSQRFQTRMLQFLGFFTGLIGIIVITAQVTISVDSTTTAIRLILVLIGALLFSFGGFSFVLPKYDEDSINLRAFGVIISGAILILVGAFL